MATQVRGGGNDRREIPFFTGNDPLFVGAFLGLLFLGMLAIFSVSQVSGSDASFRKHLMLLGIGLVPFAILRFSPPAIWQRLANLIYAGSLGLLALVLVMGEEKNGAQRWLDIGPIEVQPSELAKLGVAFTLAAFWARRQDSTKSLGTYLLSLAHIAPFLVLMGLQPHFGGALSVLVVWLAISVVAGAPWKYLVTTVALLITLLSVALNSNFLLHGYHRERIQNMFQSDQKDAGYQQKQAEYAFGMGGAGGSGFLRGEQKASAAVPEQHSDFILTVIGEELGFVGTSVVILLFGAFLLRGWMLSIRIADPFSLYASQGILTIIAVHMMVNIQMVLNIGPVVGLWLPFISYGSSAMWLCLMGVGFLLNVFSKQTDTMFGTSGRALLAVHERRGN